MALLLGIAGKARAGKDTAARYLATRHGYRHTAIAEPLKKMAAAFCCEPVGNFLEDDLKELPSDVLGIPRRRILQLLGSEAVKPLFGDEVWIKNFLYCYRKGYFGTNGVVVSDVRYDYEAQGILDEGGYILQVVRRDAGLSGAAGAHSSELGINPNLIDFTVMNNYTPGEMYAELDKIVERVAREAGR
jgi:hypothetical protein